MSKALSMARAEAASGPGETLPEGCTGHVTTRGCPTRRGTHEFREIPRDHLPTRPARGVFCCRPMQPVKSWIPPGRRARQQPLWAWQAHLCAHPRRQQAMSLLPSRGSQLDTAHPPCRGGHFPGSGQAGGRAPSAPGPQPEAGHREPLNRQQQSFFHGPGGSAWLAGGTGSGGPRSGLGGDPASPEAELGIGRKHQVNGSSLESHNDSQAPDIN